MVVNKYKVHCTCTPKSTYGFCSSCSRIKMVILLKNGWEIFKITIPGGRKVNPAWYNYYSKNNNPVASIIAGMIRRVTESKHGYSQAAQQLNFYENGNLIHQHKL